MIDDATTRRDQSRQPSRRLASHTVLPLLSTGASGSDAVLGDRLPEFSSEMLAGAPGAENTTLTQQILFADAAPRATASATDVRYHAIARAAKP